MGTMTTRVWLGADFLLGLALNGYGAALFAAGCGVGGTEITCGTGTTRQGDICIVGALDASVLESGASLQGPKGDAESTVTPVDGDTAPWDESGSSGPSDSGAPRNQASGSFLADRTVPTDSTSAPSFLENPAHSGYVDDPLVTPPLAPLWSASLGGNVSYPLIADGRVYVLAGSDLVAIDASTGAQLWRVDAGGAFAHAYDAGRIFTITESGLMASFDAASGAPGWSVSMPGQYGFSSSPTAYRGIVYVGGSGSGGTLYATDESNGHLLWSNNVQNGDDSAPAVDDTGVFVSYACVQAYGFNRTTGAPLWYYAGPCEGGGGATTVLSGGVLYTRDTMGNLALDAATGAVQGSFSASVPPAFDGTRGFFLSNGTLRAETVATKAVVWSFTGDGALASAPLVVGGDVYVGSAQGGLFAVNVMTGAVDWSTTVGAILGFREARSPAPFAAGGGLLVVPAGTNVIAYAHDQTAGGG